MILDRFLTVDLKEGDELIGSPVFEANFLTPFEKAQRKVVFSPISQRCYEIKIEKFSIPVYVSEMGFLLTLDIVSKNLFKEISGEIERDANKKLRIFYYRVHNFQKYANRAVSWGIIKPLILDEKTLNMYTINLFNDILITPSTFLGGQIISPNRWSFVSSSNAFEFEAFLNYNSGIVYIKRESIRKRKVRKIWINSPIKLYEVESGYVLFFPSGFVKYCQPTYLHFLEDPLNVDELRELTSEKGTYFACSLASLNNYSTTYEEADIKKGSINIVESLTELVFSPLQFLPLLFPITVNKSELNRMILSTTINRSCLHMIYNRLTKFCEKQSTSFIDLYESLLREQNKLANFIAEDNNYRMEIVNPSIIPFLVKKMHEENVGRWEKSLVAKTLCEENLLDKIRRINEEKWIEYLPLRGVERFLSLRAKIFKEYIEIYQGSISMDITNT